MALQVQSINELDPAVVLAVQDTLSQMIGEKYPDVELVRGVIHDTVLFLHAVCGGINQTEIQRVLNSRSLLAIRTDPTLADPELVDHVLSNFLISRKVGKHAGGNITIVVEGDATMVISAGSLYVANGLNFRTNVPITARPPGTVTTDVNDRVLEPRGDGSFEFTVPATAEDVGETGNIRINTKFDPSPPPPRFVTAFASADFTGGTSTETNTQLISRLDSGIAAKVMAGPLNIASLIRSQPVFADMRNISVIGYGDAEMSRDQHWIFPVSGGGRIDLYCQMDSLPKTVSLKKTATLVSIQATSSTWQFALTRDDAPGFYQVDGVRRLADPTDVAGFKVATDLRAWDVSGETWQPDIKFGDEAAYTRYQTAVIQFIDTATSLTGLTVGDTAEYVVSVLTQPLIGELQDFLHDYAHRNYAADVLVKSAVPCFLSVNFNIIKDVSESAPDLDAIRLAVADKINGLNFPGAVYASQIIDAVQPFLSDTQTIGPIDMHGVIRRPDGQTRVIRDQTILSLPNSPSTLVTPKTTIFMLYPDDIGLNVVNRSN